MIKHIKIIGFSLFLIAAMVMTLTGFASEDLPPGYIDISANVARGLMTIEEIRPGVKMLRGVIVIDVSPVYTKYHIPGARPYPLEGGRLDEALTNLDPEAIYLVYGQNNKDSMACAAILALMDFLPEMLVIDVSDEYSAGHLPGAIRAGAVQGGLDGVIPTLDAGQKVLVYGRGDKESKAAAKKLIQAGFESVFRLKGNFKAWTEAGYPVE